MTTNSPNPVDGDVLEELRIRYAAYLAERLPTRIKSLEIHEQKGTLGSAQKETLHAFRYAMAALTAEPVADVVTWSHPQEERKCAVHLRKFDLMPGRLYTTPPAQLLRPVELPESFYGVVQSGKAVMLPADDGQWLNKTAVMEALRQQGYEVKND